MVCCALFCCGYMVIWWVSAGLLWSFYPYSSGLLHWHWGNHTIAPVPVKQPWKIWVNESHQPATNSNHSQSMHKKTCACLTRYTEYLWMSLHWNRQVILIFSSLAVLEVVKTITSVAANVGNVVKTTILSQWIYRKMYHKGRLYIYSGVKFNIHTYI